MLRRGLLLGCLALLVPLALPVVRAAEREVLTLDDAKALDARVESVYRQKLDDPEALAISEQAVAAKERLLGPDDPEVATSLYHRGNLLRYLTREAEAADVYARAAGILERAGLNDSMDLAKILNNRGHALARVGRSGEAVEPYRKSLAIREKLLAADDPALGWPRVNLANELYRSGSVEEAEALYRRVIDTSERQGPAGELFAANVRGNFGVILLERGDLIGARTVFERQIEWMALHDEKDAVSLAYIHSNLALTLVEAGDYELARPHVERALALREGAATRDPARLAETELVYAQLEYGLGRDDEALRHYRRAVDYRESLEGADGPGVLEALQGIALVQLRGGAVEQAGATLRRVLAAREARLGPDAAAVAVTRGNLGIYFAATGDPAAAEREYRAAIAIRERVLGVDHPLLSPLLADHAAVLAKLGRQGEAIDASLRAEELRRRGVAAQARVWSEPATLAAQSANADALATALRLAPTASVATRRRVWESLARSRALVRGIVGERLAEAGASADPEVRAALEGLRRSRALAARLALDDSTTAGEYAAAASAADAAEARLATRLERSKVRPPSTGVGWNAIRDALKPGSALVAYARAFHSDVSDPTTMVAWVLRGGTDRPEAVPLGPETEIAGAVERWHRLVSRSPALEPDPEAHEKATAIAGARVRERVWDPVASRVGPASVVYLVPEGAIHAVAFRALPMRDGTPWTEGGPTVVRLTSERDLLASSRPALSSGPALVVAAARTSEGSVPLPAADAEAEGVARALGADVVKLVGRSATESAVARRSRGIRVLHLAAHGLPAPHVARTDSESSGRVSLLRRSAWAALALHPDDEADGVLSAAEASLLPLDGAEWVVLSACGSALGTDSDHEGIVGLQRSFLSAGAETTIGSLWEVDDAATAEWAAALYRARAAGATAASLALARAEREVLRARRASGRSTHPYYWGAFEALSRAR